MSIIFAAPIPGQSLTSEPKSRPFERPPQIVDPVDALDMHIENITNVEALEDAFHFLEMGLTLTALVQGVLRSAVMEGLHSIDVSLAIAPVLHEYIKGLALEADVEFDEGFENKEEKVALSYNRERGKAVKMLEKLREKTGEPALEVPQKDTQEEVEEQEPQEAPEEPMPEAPQGLMARR
jgi:hypothetical protein